MSKTREAKKTSVSAEAIARMADRGEDVSQYFTNRGKMMQPIQRVNVDFTQSMLGELDEAASELNISRQAVIKALVRQGLDQRLMARRARRSA
ncbi:MAG: CopG family transcriptional regulator [Bryobacteraceae bacterium]